VHGNVHPSSAVFADENIVRVPSAEEALEVFS
jgi:hypothetical protein